MTPEDAAPTLAAVAKLETAAESTDVAAFVVCGIVWVHIKFDEEEVDVHSWTG